MNKPGWLKDSIAKADGYYSPKGEKLKGVKLSQEQMKKERDKLKRKSSGR